MTTAQTIFAIALGSLTLLIILFTLHVAMSAAWGDRWVRRGR